MELKELNEARKEILEIDDRIAELFERRMALASRIAEVKKEFGLPVFDPDREKVVLEKAIENISGNDMKEYCQMLISKMLELSRDYQNRILDNSL